LTDVCGIDDALDVAGIIIKDQSLYNCMKANIDACNFRGFAGDGQTYVTTQPTSCIVPVEEQRSKLDSSR
jgi:hypothetical protein